MTSNYFKVDISAFDGDLRVMNVDPPVLTIGRFLSPEQCDALVAAAEVREGWRLGEKAVSRGRGMPMGQEYPPHLLFCDA